MLNSRYAPVVALTALAIVLVAIAGWFLAIKPQIDQMAEIGEKASEVETNTEQIQAESARLDTFARELEELPDYTTQISTHSPGSFQVEAVRDRVANAISESNAEIVSLEHEGLTDIEGWALPANSLPSASVAALFQTGPVHQTEGEAEFTPVVAPATGEEAGRDFYAVTVTVQMAGAGDELVSALRMLEDSEAQLFQIHELKFESRPETASTVPGVSDPEDGDALLTVTGFFYLQGLTVDLPDEGEYVGGSLSDVDAFTPIEGGVEQPGAN